MNLPVAKTVSERWHSNHGWLLMLLAGGVTIAGCSIVRLQQLMLRQNLTKQQALESGANFADPVKNRLLVKVNGIEPSGGTCVLQLFSISGENEAPRLFKTESVPTADATSIDWNVLDIPLGMYAITVLYDLNGDEMRGKADTGEPERFAISNDAAGTYEQPQWEAAAFAVQPKNTFVELNLRTE